jgi:replication factor C large subunit
MSGSIPWIKKYLPKKTSEVVGQSAAVNNLRSFIGSFPKGKKKAALIYGPSGTGKTSSIYAMADELNLEVLEVNASDFRNKDQIESKLGAASKQLSLFGRKKLILVDEIDGLSGNDDRGGVAAIANTIDGSSFPIIMTATNPWENKLSTLRSRSELISFVELDFKDIFAYLDNICKKEGIKYDEYALKGLARRAGGDLRAAINDLQVLTSTGNELTKESLDELGERNKTETMMSALVKIFKNSDPKIAVQALDNVDEDLDEAFLWIDENLPKEYSDPQSLADSYDYLSKADVFRRRIRRWQHWRFMVYISALITGGVAVSKKEKNKEYVKYTPTTRILKIWRANMKYQKRKAISLKIAEHTHTSAKEVMKDWFYYKQMFKDKAMAENISRELELDKEELDYLRE